MRKYEIYVTVNCLDSFYRLKEESNNPNSTLNLEKYVMPIVIKLH